MVFFERAVPGGLDGQFTGLTGIVQLNTLVDDVLVSPLEAQMFQPQLLFKEDRQFIGGHRVSDDGGARRLFGNDHAQQGDECVAVHFRTIGEDHSPAVTVAVKDHAKVSFCVECSLACGFHCCWVLRIRHMIGEGPIRFQVNTAGNVCTESFQNIGREESGCAVPCVNDDMQAFQRMVIVFRVDFPADNSLHMIAVNRAHVKVFRGNGAGGESVRGQKLFRIFLCVLFCECRRCIQNRREFGFGDSAFFGKEFHPVAVERQMAGRDHHRAVEITFRQDGGLEHSRCGDQSAVVNLCDRKTGTAGGFDLSGGHTAVVSHSDAQCCRFLPAFFRKERGKGAGDIGYQWFGKRQFFRFGGNCRTADVIAVLNG